MPDRPSRIPLMAALAFSALALFGCTEQTIQVLTPSFEIQWPEEQGFLPGNLGHSVLSHGQVVTGSFSDIEVSILNSGRGSLYLCDVYLAAATFSSEGTLESETRIDADTELSTSPLPSESTLGAGIRTQFTLRYVPLLQSEIHASTYLVVKHEDNWDCAASQGSPLYIPIVGDAHGDPVADIYSQPQSVDFGTTVLGFDLPAQTVLVGNAGPGLLEISEVILDDPTHFSLEAGTLGSTGLATGQHDFLTVRFTPAYQGTLAANILISSNDPDEAPYWIQLIGTANPEGIDDPPGDDDDDPTPPGAGVPIAICGSTQFANPLEVVTIESLSFHTGGLSQTFSLSYSWTLTPPAGSATTLNGANTSSATTSPYVDLVGTYVAHLTVTDSAGLTDSCNQTVEVLPNENFRVELFWDMEDDFDLHLIEANDGSGNQGSTWSDGDCHFGNCQGLGLDWGVSGNTYDNPYLDLDDIGGLGPENINITDPALSPYDGWYQVMVHDYTGSTTDNEGTTSGTVHIYLNQVLVQTYTFSMTGDGDEYWVAKIHWPSGDVQPCAGLSGC